MNNNKVVIIGCGNVGMSYAYALLNQRTYVNKLLLIDLDEKRVVIELRDVTKKFGDFVANDKINIFIFVSHFSVSINFVIISKIFSLLLLQGHLQS